MTVPLFALAIKRGWSRWIQAIVGALALLSIAAFLVVEFGFRLNQKVSLPTEAFLKSGTGKVFDMGAGTGRSAIMVLEARPNTTLVALDQFGASYEQHFGEAGSQQQIVETGCKRLMANFEAAGVDRRATIHQGGVRKMPLENAPFDAIVSAYAIDQLGLEGRRSAFAEAARVLKPGGEVLLLVVAKDFWLNFTFGPMMLHGRMPSQGAWIEALQKYGFTVTEAGTPPASFYFLAHKT